MFALMNVSNRFEYSNPVTMNFWILGPDGNRVARSAVTVPPFSYRLVSTTEVLSDAGVLEEYRENGGMGMFLGYSKNGTLVPLSLTRNKVSGAIACDHTLPPVFYVTTWGGEKRYRRTLASSRSFSPRHWRRSRADTGGRGMSALAELRSKVATALRAGGQVGKGPAPRIRPLLHRVGEPA